MLHPQILIRQAHQDRPRLSRKRSPRSNAGRRLASQRPSLEAELTYRKALREVSALWAGRVVAAIGSLLSASVPAPDGARQDAKETPLEKVIRLSSRPANDAVGVVRAALGTLKTEAKGFGKQQARLINTIAAKVDKHNAAEFERVVGIDVRSLGTSVTDALDAFRAENVDLIQSIPDEMLEQVGDVLEQAWTSGERVETLSDLLQKRFGVSESKGDLIARDQTLKLNGQLARERQQAAGITKYVWSTSSDERVRGNPSGKYPNPSKTGRIVSDHYHLNGKTFTYGEPPITNEATGDRNEPGQDYQCLPGDTKIALTSRVRRAYRRRYSGKLTEFVMGSGVALKCTPNHPILTASGWKAAEAVQVGDYVFDIQKQRFDFAEANVKEREASISDVFGALSMLWFTERRAGVTSQFHGDGTNEQIDIVNIDWELLFHDETAGAENFRKFLLAIPDTSALGGGKFEQSFAALGFPSDRGMRRFCDRLALLDSRIREANQISLTAPTQSRAVALQEIANGLAHDSVALAERFDRGTLSIQAETLLLREWFCIRGRAILLECPDSPSAERLGQVVGMHGKLPSDLANRSPVFKHPLRVVEKRISEFPFSGHVYNLETENGWYAASIAVRNCRCVAAPVLDFLDDAGDAGDSGDE